jgi:molybdate transport system substrate-binding protein
MRKLQQNSLPSRSPQKNLVNKRMLGMPIKCIFSVYIVAATLFSNYATAAEIVVSAATSLTNAFTSLGQAFETRQPGTKVVLNFGASDMLMMQISNGAPVDVFASADQVAMDKAVSRNAVEKASRRDFASNQVVVIVPADSALKITSLKDLSASSVKRVTYGNPASVPIGRYAQEALQASDQWAAVSAKAVLAQNVRQSLDYVVRGEVDAGFVFATDAEMVGNKVRIAFRIQPQLPVTYPIALVSHTKQSKNAQAFIDFVLSDPGQAVLAKYGFLKP